ncbi:MAG: hypothetical protein B7C24_17395 [Bacteroidetes bacterium 4572_77]|nr:MAG: hypothetical protein B7C24_17395 [Bacteroidetes bacterium 4572_77]
MGKLERRLKMNKYIVDVIFMDEDENYLSFEQMQPHANSAEDAYDEIEKEIEDNPELYPSEYYETKLIDVC